LADHILPIRGARGTIEAVSVRTPTDPGCDEQAALPATLGDALDAAKVEGRVSEDDWVRLVLSVADCDVAALQGLYHRAHRLVFTLVARVIHDREIAEEVTIEVFHDIWLKAARYDPANETVLGWIMNLARARALDRLHLEQQRADDAIESKP
jgi:hypothetical protein